MSWFQESHNELGSIPSEHEEGHEQEGVNSDVDNDSLDGEAQLKNGDEPGLDNDDQAQAEDSAEVENNVFESVVFKGKMMKRSLSTHSQLQSRFEYFIIWHFGAVLKWRHECNQFFQYFILYNQFDGP